MSWTEGTLCSPWGLWTGWVISRSVSDSSRIGCGQRKSRCPSLSVYSSPHHRKRKVGIYSLLWWMILPFLSLSLISCCFFFAFSLFLHRSKRPEDWEESIFVQHKECGYRLRENVYFHMYISTSPCGDGRLNSPYEITTDRKTLDLSVAFMFIGW